ncbi:MAG: hypothetical protein ABS76_27835 [Pelagibacterium sp. SCN 64-44]|nr:MAG: hypothetical protein ABS76_27835 [Pelagibacterium sp. SCN 64-44]
MRATERSFDHLNHCYSSLLSLCDDLETVADSLPSAVRPHDCKVLAARLDQLLVETHHEEERMLMPLLMTDGRAELRQLANRLRREHEVDAVTLQEVLEALAMLAGARPMTSPDATGYLLRAFFESLRRHIYTEQDIIALLTDARN